MNEIMGMSDWANHAVLQRFFGASLAETDPELPLPSGARWCASRTASN